MADRVYSIPYGAFTPGYVIGDDAGTNAAGFASVTDGEFNVTIDGTSADVTGINFSGISTLAEGAAIIQTAIRAAVPSNDSFRFATCTIVTTDNFKITSGSRGQGASSVVVDAVSGGSGTAIEGAGYMNIQYEILAVTTVDADATLAGFPMWETLGYLKDRDDSAIKFAVETSDYGWSDWITTPGTVLDITPFPRGTGNTKYVRVKTDGGNFLQGSSDGSYYFAPAYTSEAYLGR